MAQLSCGVARRVLTSILFLMVASPAHPHEEGTHRADPPSPGHGEGFWIHSPRAPRIRDDDPRAVAPAIPRSIDGHVVVVEDDGTMIEDGVFVLDRVMPAFTTFLPDSFDLVNLFGASSFPDPMLPSASEFIVRNQVAGLGMSGDLNRNAVIGIHTLRLKSIQLMNDVRHFGASPTSDVPRFSVGFTGVELLGSEVLHMSGCFARIDQVTGADILGRLNAHWSYFLSSQASIMEGCRWQDNGDGSFTTIEVLNGISELDEYLLGLRPASLVQPMFVLDDPVSSPGGAGDATFPYPGFTTQADRVDFTIGDVIAQNGPRVPDASHAPHHFTMAFTLVVPEGTPAPAADLAFLEQFRSDWENFFAAQTDGVGSMTTTIPRIPPVAEFDVDRIAGTAPLTVRFTARPTGTVSWLYWDFGDGSPFSDEIRPMHTYASPGVYSAKLTVMGLPTPSTKTRPIRVGPCATIVAHDFDENDEGWAPAAPNTAATGRWEWGDPEGTMTFGVYVQPEDDDTPDGAKCWSTDKDAGDFPSHRDVDNGVTTILSPQINLSAAADPCVSYSRWYSNSLGANSDQEVMTISASANDGASWVVLETVGETATQWIRRQFRLSDFIAPSSTMRFRVQASDFSGESLVEAAFDNFVILDAGTVVSASDEGVADRRDAEVAAALTPRPNPFTSSTAIRYELPATQAITISVFDLGGRLVRLLDEGTRGAGRREVAWDGRDSDGRTAAAGVYVVRIETRAGTVSGKIQLVR